MSDHRSEFILESRDHLAVIEQSLLALEKSSRGDESRLLIEQGLRAIHSLKGDSGFLGYTVVRNLAHAMESVLEQFRSGAKLPPTQAIESLLMARDRLAALVEDLGNCQAANIDDTLRTLQSQDFGGLQPLPLDIDLNGWIANQDRSLVGLFITLDNLGLVQDPKLVGWESAANLASPSELKTAAIRLTCKLSTKASIDEVARVVGTASILSNNDSSDSRSGKTISIDLTKWHLVTRTSLVELFREIDRRCSVSEQRLRFAIHDLSNSLPAAPIEWQATIDAAQEIPEIALIAPGITGDECQPTVEDALPSPRIKSASPTSQAKSPIRLQEGEASATTGENRNVERRIAMDSHHEAAKANAAIETESTSRHPMEPKSTPGSSRATSHQDAERLRSLRINVELLDRLMNLIGELTLIRNQTQVTFAEEEGDARNIIQRLNSVTSELQDTVLQTRMQPVGNLFGRFPRMVRDLARQLGKEVEVITEGQEVELDKTVLERLSDPLTHLIRNSIDHGLETPDVRQASGKPRTGRIVLSATPADGQVYIEIRDDGRGIDPAAVKAKALEIRLRTETELERMSTRELFSLIVLPGFTTAKQVTDVSGRGVGLDVVRTNVEQLEGSLTIDSWIGAGTSMVLRVPLTLAIVPCLIVTVSEDRFAVPQRELEEIVCLHPGGKLKLEQAFDTEVFRLREALLPVVRFAEVLAHPKPYSTSAAAETSSRDASTARDARKIEYILVLRTNAKRFGLLVDNVQGREEIVVKPMHAAMKRLTLFSGATMMGDGRVALIANVEGIAEHARCFEASAEDSSKASVRDPREVHRVLLFEYGPSEQFALPLVQVRRVELLEMSRIERIGDREFVTIEGTATRILRLNQLMRISACEDQSTMFLILPKFVPEPMGILAHRIVDTESLAIELQTIGGEPGVLGTAVVRNRLSLFLDVQQLRELLFGGPADSSEHTVESKDSSSNILGSATKRVLLVDDTPFFREVVKRYLVEEGIDIVTAADGSQGLQLLAADNFDLVVSDIEMPNMDGWQFCKAARDRGYRMPFVALTSLAKLEHEHKAIACGFDDFEEKLDHDRLKNKVHYWLEKCAERMAIR